MVGSRAAHRWAREKHPPPPKYSVQQTPVTGARTLPYLVPGGLRPGRGGWGWPRLRVCRSLPRLHSPSVPDAMSQPSAGQSASHSSRSNPSIHAPVLAHDLTDDHRQGPLSHHTCPPPGLSVSLSTCATTTNSTPPGLVWSPPFFPRHGVNVFIQNYVYLTGCIGCSHRPR